MGAVENEMPRVESNVTIFAPRDLGAAGARPASDLFLTPFPLAARVIEATDLRPGDRILEPSAGTGRLIDAAGASSWGWSGALVAVESNRALAEALVLKYDTGKVGVRFGDFLEVTPAEIGGFDRIVMNPPFSDRLDLQHVLHASHFLKPGGRLVAIMAAGVTFRDDRASKAFREFVDASGGTIEPLPDDAFKEAGTSVRTVLVTIEGVAVDAAVTV